jgi:hypothetical protein
VYEGSNMGLALLHKPGHVCHGHMGWPQGKSNLRSPQIIAKKALEHPYKHHIQRQGGTHPPHTQKYTDSLPWGSLHQVSGKVLCKYRWWQRWLQHKQQPVRKLTLLQTGCILRCGLMPERKFNILTQCTCLPACLPARPAATFLHAAFIMYALEQKLHMSFVMSKRSQAHDSAAVANSNEHRSQNPDLDLELPAFAFNLWCLLVGLLVLLGCVWVAVCCQIAWLVQVDLHNLPLKQLL